MYFIRVYNFDNFKIYKGFIFRVNKMSINKSFHVDYISNLITRYCIIGV
ncbi:hypothetical protein SAMN03080603_00327 [Acetomicrobium thermoterrenum DSM 13490]|uniref:Uncharacterized protein n=1 Tax=Acetomicrobium thermoterrenum DSM 13490 TaxID=1120987 RepID=A0A1H3E1L5_9BACT|nr:hypothetical protein SAMN03080603_00327 [Acetomicrobium thermoterrenum DSM 13490]